MAEHSKSIPVQHIIGFVLSIVLTLLAAWAALGSNLPVKWIIAGILTLAVIQAGIQLFMFMHMTESESRNGHVPWNMMFHGFVLAAIIVAGSLFTMSWGFDHHPGKDDMGTHQEEEQQHGGH
ncbi:cytochrome aa3 quinol oxidase subunit IV [Thalassobacillus pellis]|uniref:cytochrome aa3 quinol oxidase subunit IV n=1 Tax=Thalassobacillus pellis TaxID=748008 RepID=UPI00195F5B02|nr:cytochrome aa3 quinol oxidase subunit IV [Thalassobacillus pellis]MBM7553852.1 cytochrome aa3-600 menaquinol oxidase subunit 4 [Thalassobacillus pellis]